MAAVDTIDTQINDCLGLKVAAKVLQTDKQPLVATGPALPGQGDVNSTKDALVVEADRFPLDQDSFVKLQVYLRAALKLPANEAEFKLTYPQKLFSTYMAKDTKNPVLYELMTTVLTGIHQNCFKFQNGTMDRMMVLAGEIGHFSWETSGGVDRVAGNLAIILTPGADLSEPRVRDAADDICNVLEDLSVKAKEVHGRCEKTFKELSEFRTLTVIDKDRLETLTQRTSAVLPEISDLNREMRNRADTAYTNLNNLAKTQNELITKVENKSGPKWYYAVPWIGYILAIADTVTKNTYEKRLAEATREYENIFNAASVELSSSIQFRERCNNLKDRMNHVSEAINDAISALGSMMSAFTDLQVGCNAVISNLDLAKGKVSNEQVRRRKSTLESLEKAKYMWAKVSDLARRFQEHGTLVEKEFKDLADTPEPNPWLDLVSANYGGVDVSNYARVLFNYGDSIRIRSCEPGFQEPWKGVVKTLSVLSKLDTSKRMFVCKEYSGSNYLHILRPNKDISQDRVSDAQYNLINPLKGPSNTDVKILSIIWGPSEVRSQAVYDYCYSKLNSGSIEWSNSNMGGDTWGNYAKSGVIYYQVGGSDEVKQCTGRENTSTQFTA